jgi:hypothetical protein
LIDAGGAYSGGGLSSQGAGTGLGDAGQAHGSAAGNDGGEGGAAGEPPFGTPPTPLAVYPAQLAADVGCGAVVPDAVLLIQNAGGAMLSVTSASGSPGYAVSTALPLSIASGAAAQLLVTPPAPQSSAKVGDTSSGTLSFTTNEPGTPTHTVTLSSELFGASVEFLDHSGTPISSGLTLTYLDAGDCPDTVKYRVHNTGNVAFTLFGPNFPVNFGGSTAGPSGQSIAPDDYLELTVSGSSSPNDVCAASGQLTFTTSGAFCGDAPALNVIWPAPASAGSTCACSVAE